MKRTSTLLLLSWLIFGVLGAQDFHYSQFYHAPHHLNPALTGIFEGDGRLMGNYKSQWTDVPVDYKTFTAAYDRKFLGRSDAKGFFSGGIALNYDRAGDSKLTWGDVDLNLSYTFGLSQQFFLTVGGQAGLVSRAFDEDNLRFDNQFNGQIFDENLTSGENFANDSRLFPDFGAGINLRFQAKQTSNLVHRNDRRTKIDVGVALFHLFEPEQSFIEDTDVPLERRLSPYAMGTLQIAKPIDLVGNLTFQNQGEYEEFLAMGGVRLHLNNKLGRQFNILVGMGMRRNEIQDSWWPTVELGLNNIEIALNYDLNVSRFDIATENRGGLEISLRYLIRNVRKPLSFKSCPLI